MRTILPKNICNFASFDVKGRKGQKGGKEFKIQNSKFKIASKREQRVLAHYAEREQLKDTNGGLKFKIIN